MKQELHDSPKLDILVSAIETRELTSSEQLIQLLKSLDLHADEFSPFADTNHSTHLSYGRTRLYTGRNFLVYLMTWAKGDFTAIHNHGQTDWGAVYFLGDVNHRLYRLEDNRLLLAGKSIIPAGTAVAVKGELIHAMGNLAEGYSMSLHVYGSNRGMSVPNSTSCIYELEKKRVRVTSGEAYFNGTECLEEPRTDIQTNEETLHDYLGILLPYYEKNNHTEMAAYIRSVLVNPALYFNAVSRPA
jgi:predicted metal-dependent enzyme (double-stranded beta helix superfamily)